MTDDKPIVAEKITVAPSPKIPARRWILRCILWAVVLAVLLGIGIATAGLLAYDYVTRPGVAGEPVAVTVPEGATGKQVGHLLVEKGLIDHEIFFRAAMRLSHTTKGVQRGFYLLPRGLSPVELLRLIQKGPKAPFDPDDYPDYLKVTVPEGLTIAQTASLFGDPDAFKVAATDPALLARLGVKAATLEGYLMPDTYFFEKKPTEREVVERMVAQFEKEYAELLAEIPEGPSRDKSEVVTVASLVEREARVEAERSVVASVIANRLKTGELLALDSTLQYALGKYGQRMLDADKEVDSPYNTYRRAGLPPGPISNPGVASLRAALQPADTKYRYFVSNADGKTHTFSSTIEEHNRAVARFRKDISAQRKQQKEQTPHVPTQRQ